VIATMAMVKNLLQPFLDIESSKREKYALEDLLFM
jgi:hypothetical protein